LLCAKQGLRRATSPRMSRFVGGLFATVAVSDVLNHAYVAGVKRAQAVSEASKGSQARPEANGRGRRDERGARPREAHA
jgi:hypothetical protein